MAPAASRVNPIQARASTAIGDENYTDSSRLSPIQIALIFTGFALFFFLVWGAWF